MGDDTSIAERLVAAWHVVRFLLPAIVGGMVVCVYIARFAVEMRGMHSIAHDAFNNPLMRPEQRAAII